MSNLDELFDRALRFVTSEHNTAVMHRDELLACRRRELDHGLVTNALGYEVEIAKLEGRIDGLTTATVQIRMVRDNERIEP